MLRLNRCESNGSLCSILLIYCCVGVVIFDLVMALGLDLDLNSDCVFRRVNWGVPVFPADIVSYHTIPFHIALTAQHSHHAMCGTDGFDSRWISLGVKPGRNGTSSAVLIWVFKLDLDLDSQRNSRLDGDGTAFFNEGNGFGRKRDCPHLS